MANKLPSADPASELEEVAPTDPVIADAQPQKKELILTVSELQELSPEDQLKFRHNGGTAIEDAAKPKG